MSGANSRPRGMVHVKKDDRTSHGNQAGKQCLAMISASIPV